jgi:hypothetical protein
VEETGIKDFVCLERILTHLDIRTGVLELIRTSPGITTKTSLNIKVLIDIAEAALAVCHFLILMMRGLVGALRLVLVFFVASTAGIRRFFRRRLLDLPLSMTALLVIVVEGAQAQSRRALIN